MEMSELDYHLPPELIATHPAHPRDHCRLMIVRLAAGQVEHRRFYELPELLEPGDLMVVNDTKVLPARLNLRKTTGAAIPGLFLKEMAAGRWEVMLRSRGKLAVGDHLAADATAVTIQIAARGEERGHWIIDVSPASPAPELLSQIGHVPLPPYIDKARTAEHLSPAQAEAADREEYQTIYARDAGSLAAPTAGLHFTPAVLERLTARGIHRAAVTLHVGLGTFLPVEAATLEAHTMHAESYVVPAETVVAIRAQRQRAGRILVIGTTAARTLEAASEKILADGPAKELSSTTTLCISPGFQFTLTDLLLTNFHLPRSTLLALLAAKVGLERMRNLYVLAIAEKYRFYSYGDAMLILP